MEAPDKIYQCRFAAGEHDVAYRLTPEPYAENTEYIRKDLLLKWLENKVSLSYGVATDAFVEVIDKINSL